jgi:hypothetical protein
LKSGADEPTSKATLATSEYPEGEVIASFATSALSQPDNNVTSNPTEIHILNFITFILDYPVTV